MTRHALWVFLLIGSVQCVKDRTDLFMEKRWPFSFFSMPMRSSSFFLREATIFSFLSSPVFLASASVLYTQDIYT